MFALPAATRGELEKDSVGVCVVEFCCSSDSQLRRVAKEFGILKRKPQEFQPPLTRTTKGRTTRTNPGPAKADSPREKGAKERGHPTTTPTRTRTTRTSQARTKEKGRRPTRGDNCPFKHEKITVPGTPAPQAKAKAASAKATSKAAAVAMVVAALTSGATASSLGPNCTLDVIGDTGAGEHLGSKEAFVNQGVSSDVVDQFCGTSSGHVAFETGGGKKHSNESIGVWTESLKTAANMFMLKSCPLVYSIEYLGLSRDFADLTDPLAVSQIELWMTEQASNHKVLHLLGSLPTLDGHKRNTRNSLPRFLDRDHVLLLLSF